MKLLFTGASGFLGKKILPVLAENFDIDTLGLEQENTYNLDITREQPILNKKYDIVLHALGKAHVVPKTTLEEEEFHKVNYEGTVKICETLEKINIPKSFIFISSTVVYGIETGELITEKTTLQGNTPYALSKIKAEQFLIKWCKDNGVILSILRPSLIAGKTPKGNLKSLIDGITKKKYFSIGEGKAKRSLLMAEDIAFLVPKLIEKGGIYNICDDHHPSFRELEHLISKQLGGKKIIKIPYIMAKAMALVGDIIGKKAPFNSLVLNKMTKSLTFSNEKAKRELNWKPLNVIENFKIK